MSVTFLLAIAIVQGPKVDPVEVRATATVPDFSEAAAQLAEGEDSEPQDVPVACEDEVRARDLANSKVAMPPIWGILKSYAYAQLPRHKKDEFEAVWAPIVVTGTSETVPGLGLAGRF